MYLSRLILNPRSRDARRDISSPYELHRTLMRAFPTAAQNGADRVLFRLDLPREGGYSMVLVQSETSPDWSYLSQDNYLLDDFSDRPNPEWKEFDPQFTTGQILAFRLRANPTKREAVKRDDGGRGRRLGLLRPEDQVNWLEHKAEEGGFSILQVTPVNEGLKHGTRKQTQELSLLSVRFEGVLQVGDPEQFRLTLQKGIGSGKGLGFGLLSLARA